ncbi:Fc.00g093530.m01.CDS01 [Cosmosporella sp. VM-42]
MTVIKVEAFSDFVCAWCYIGKRKLEMAISLYQKVYPGGKYDTFLIRWRPYYLNYGPLTHSVGKSEVADVKLKDLGPEQRTKLYERMDQIGRAVGINFEPGGKVGDTRHAHRLVHLSRTKAREVQNSLVEKIFEAYHELEKDISNKEILRELATESGLDVAEVDEWLNSDMDESIVDKEEQENREAVADTGVPTYVIQGVHQVDGAKDIEDFMEMFIKVKEGNVSE